MPPPAAIAARWIPREARWAPALLVLIGLLTHLPALGHPSQVTFDEVHWGKAVTAYCCTGQRQFDVHPPHGKLLLTAGAVLGGYRGGMSFDAIGQPYGPVSAAWLRAVPAVCGVLIPVLLFLLLRGVGASVPTAWIAGLLIALDNAFVLETRTMLFDGVLVAATLGALVCLLAVPRATGARAVLWSAACGGLIGLAVGTKFTGLAVAAIAIAYVWWPASPWRRAVHTWTPLLVIAGAAAAVYLGGWALHFALLTAPGPGDAFHPTSGRFLEDLWVTHRTMFTVNAGMTATHPDASRPLTWLVMKVAPFFWTSDGATLYLVGNPVVWWGSSLLLIVIGVNTALMRVTRLRLEPRAAQPMVWWLLFAFAVSYVPFFAVTRVLFLYHYLTPLVFATAFVLLWLETAGWIRTEAAGRQRASYVGVQVAAVLGFVAISPLTYGVSAGAYGAWLAALIRSWR